MILQEGVIGDAAIAKEIEAVTKELEELAAEKLKYEQDVAQTQVLVILCNKIIYHVLYTMI